MTTSPEVRALAAEIAELRAALSKRGDQLAYSSFDDGAILEFETDPEAGSVKQVAQYGLQFDGSHVAATLAGPKPPTCTVPLLTPVAGGLIVRWDGLWTDALMAPMDFSRVEVHASQEEGFSALEAFTLRATIETPRGNDVFVPTAADGTWYVKFVARSLPGNAGDASAEASGEPLPAGGGEGGPTTVFSMNAPTVLDPGVEGQEWYQIDASNEIIGYWNYSTADGWKVIRLSGNALAADAVDGKTITGAFIRTAAAGPRWEMKGEGEGAEATQHLKAFSGMADETAPGGIESTVQTISEDGEGGTTGALRIFAPGRTSADTDFPSELVMTSGGTVINDAGNAGGSSRPEVSLQSESITEAASESIGLYVGTYAGSSDPTYKGSVLSLDRGGEFAGRGDVDASIAAGSFGNTAEVHAHETAATTVEYNRCSNPSFALNTTGWLGGTNCALTRVAGTVGSPAADGSSGFYGRITTSAIIPAGTVIVSLSAAGGMPAAPGQLWGGEIRVRNSGAIPDGRILLSIRAFNAANADLGEVAGASDIGMGTTTQWDILNCVATAACPAGTTYVRAFLTHLTTAIASGKTFDFDMARFAQVSALGEGWNLPYFDGDNTDTEIVTYDWTGTVGASSSTKTTPARTVARLSANDHAQVTVGAAWPRKLGDYPYLDIDLNLGARLGSGAFNGGNEVKVDTNGTTVAGDLLVASRVRSPQTTGLSTRTRSPGVKVRKTSNQALAASTYTVLSWDAVFDASNSDATVWVAGSPTRFVAPVTGRYRISGSVVFASNATSFRLVSLARNGTRIDFITAAPVSGTSSCVPFVFDETYLAAGDYIEIFANTGVALSVGSAGGIDSTCALSWIGPA